MYISVNRHKQGRNLAVFTSPVEKNLLVLSREVVRCVWLPDVLLDTTGWITEQKTLKSDGFGRFVDGLAREMPLVQLDIPAGPAENRFDNFLADLDGPRNLFCRKPQLPQQFQLSLIQRFFPPAQRLESFAGKHGQICQVEVDFFESTCAPLDLSGFKFQACSPLGLLLRAFTLIWVGATQPLVGPFTEVGKVHNAALVRIPRQI